MRPIFALLALFTLSACDARQIEACAPSESVLCGIVRPEDLEPLPDSRWMLVSELGLGDRPGRILLADPRTKEIRVLAAGVPAVTDPATFARCGPPPESLRPRGFHLTTDNDGGLHLLVVNGARVERYRLDTAGEPALTWEGCVTIPPEVFANNVAGYPDGGFVVSHMYDPPRTFLHDFKLILGRPTGYAVAWTSEGGWKRVPNTEASFANGIQVDPATGRTYVSSMYAQRVIAVDRDGGNPVVSEKTPIQADNLSWSDDGRLLGAGHTGFPVYGTTACSKHPEAPCSFPFAVVAFDPKTLAHREIFRTAAGDIPAASVAILKDKVLYFGSAFGDRITLVGEEESPGP